MAGKMGPERGGRKPAQVCLRPCLRAGFGQCVMDAPAGIVY